MDCGLKKQMAQNIRHIMFDFDGTLADTSEGIVHSIHYAYDKLQLGHVSDAAIRNVIGPPLEEMFSILLNTDDGAFIRQAVFYFRERYAKEGVWELCLYPEVINTLSCLKEKDINLYIVTSKPEKFVYDICNKQDVLKFFTAINGVPLKEKGLSKAQRMKRLMAGYGITCKNGIMVGDRPEDAWAAEKNGIHCIGVTYGFGKEEELIAAGCIRVIKTLNDLFPCRTPGNTI